MSHDRALLLALRRYSSAPAEANTMETADMSIGRRNESESFGTVTEATSDISLKPT